jgi:hypothetical protein
VDPRGEWRKRESGLIVPASSVADGTQTRTPVRPRRSATADWVMARATQLTALVAAAALGLSIFTAVRQDSFQRAEADARLRANASRVQAWQSNSVVIVQNASPTALQLVFLEWRLKGRWIPSGLTYVGLISTLEPCTRWTLSNASETIKRLEDAYFLNGVSFADANGGWKVGPSGHITGLPYLWPPEDAGIEFLEWDPKSMRADPVAGCSISS